MAKFNMTVAAQKERAWMIIEQLAGAYPDVYCTLDFDNPLQLLISTILAAQCTDERVNKVTPALYAKYKTAQDFADAPEEKIQDAIHSCGFYKQKTKSIQNTCRAIVERFDGKVPNTMTDLVQLNGVGRKTANVLLGECFEPEGVVVDTHCKRITKRLALTKNDDPTKVEQDLMKLLPRKEWRNFSHRLVFHGRAICNARAPKCSECCLRELCPFPDTREGKKLLKH